ncbi:MAG: hypothetical protein JNJ47_08240, partial [Alphaproteobacteria bacterium]|nr:hypothetical protein [Alphaproteobacteria bacterium]
MEKKAGGLTLYSYLASWFNVEVSPQYGIHMPKAPAVHPYHMSGNERKNFGFPAFPYAARQSVKDINPSLFPVFRETKEILGELEIAPEAADYFYVVQDDAWEDKSVRLLRPQTWAIPGAPYISEKTYNEHVAIKVKILSLDNSIGLIGPSEGTISSHNSKDSTGKGSPVVISSGSDFPMLSGVKANQTNFFVSMVVIPSTKRAAVTFHTILSDDDLDLLQTAKISNLSDLQYWLVNLFQSRHGASSSSSSLPYSNWATGAVSATPVRPVVSTTTQPTSVVASTSARGGAF